MKITFFCPNTNWTKQLNDQLVNEAGKFFLVTAEYQGPDVYGNEMDEFPGLDIAQKLNPEEAPIILCSILDESDFIKFDRHIQKFRAILARKRVGFLRLPFSSEELLEKYKELMAEQKTEDLLALELNKMSEYDKEMGSIQHSIISSSGYKLGDQRVSEAISKARSIGVEGTDEEVFTIIKSFRHNSRGNKKFSGKFLPGVFCDIENTLIKNGAINTKMLEILKEHSKTLPVTLWSGATLELPEIEKKLRGLNIFWKFLPKFVFDGAEVEMAYDDEDQETLLEKYGFTIRNFIKIS